MDHHLTTTAFTLDGYRITRNLGVVRGIMVRSRSIFGTIGGALQTLIGGNISLFTSLCEKTRSEAIELMLAHAQELGANAVVGVRYDATEVMNGVTGNALSGEATATVRLMPDATFDCTDVTGKVFNDANRNGLQDEGEEGLAGVRVVTARQVFAHPQNRTHTCPTSPTIALR